MSANIDLKTREEAFIAPLRGKLKDEVLASLTVTIHNARAIMNDYREIGETLWQRPKGSREGALGYYQALMAAFKSIGQARMVKELELTVEELEQVAAK